MNRPSAGLAALGAGLLSIAAVAAAQVDTLTLEGAIQRALRDGPSVVVARETFTARRANHESFQAGLLPQISLQGQAPGYFRSISSVVQPDGSTVFAPQSQANATLGLTVSQALPWTGGELSLSSSLNRIDLLESKLTSYRSTPLSLSYRQPLNQLNTLGWDVESEALAMRIAERTWNEALEDISADVVAKFFETAQLSLAMEMSSKNVQINDTLYQISVGRYNVGKIAENELLQSELAALNARMQLASATTSYDRARKALCFAMGLPPESRLHLALPEEVPAVSVEPSRAVSEAMQNRSEVLSTELDLHSARRAVSSARFAHSFSGTLTLNAGFNQRAGTVPDAYRHLLDQQQFNVSFQVPVMQWGAGSSAIEAALADEERVKRSGEISLRLLQDDVSAHVASLHQLRTQVIVSAKAETIAVRRFEVSKDRYLIGKIDVTNLFLAQNEKDSARRARVQTLGDFWTVYYRLRRMTLHDFLTDRPIARPTP
ncbi:MAG: TolC family protein [Bacteroidetes bacterium]|jgi:outer membrane protein TolC|nr:TolC family protein [Bacteroidota bacterium]